MTDKPRRRGALWGPDGSGGMAVYEPASDGLHVLNASAFAIWELCDGETGTEEMVAAIAELTGLDATVAATEVTATVEALRALGLVET